MTWLGDLYAQLWRKKQLPSVPATDIFSGEYKGRFGQMVGVLHIIENGYLLSLGRGDGSIHSIHHCPDELSVGKMLLDHVAKENLK